MKANKLTNNGEITPEPKKIRLTNFDGKAIYLVLYSNTHNFQTDILKVVIECPGQKEDAITYVKRDEILMYLFNGYKGKDVEKNKDIYSQQQMDEMWEQEERKFTDSQLNPKYTSIIK